MGCCRFVILRGTHRCGASEFQTLDLSFNAVGSSGSAASTLPALAAALQDNTTLTHLSLANNALGASALKPLSAGLNKNDTLLGLHMEGKSCAAHMLCR